MTYNKINWRQTSVAMSRDHQAKPIWLDPRVDDYFTPYELNENEDDLFQITRVDDDVIHYVNRCIPDSEEQSCTLSELLSPTFMGVGIVEVPLWILQDPNNRT